MTPQRYVTLSPAAASMLIQQKLEAAQQAFAHADLELALDTWIAALGFGLQLGPSATEQVLVSIMKVVREMAREQDANALSALGPAFVDLTRQIGEASALPPSPVMHAWAEVTSALGAIIGQVGLILTIAPGHRAPMIKNLRAQALLLDDATHDIFALTKWTDQIASASADGAPGLDSVR